MKNNGYCMLCQSFFDINEGENYVMFCTDCVRKIIKGDEENETKDE